MCFEYFPLVEKKPIETDLFQISLFKIESKNDLYRETLITIQNKKTGKTHTVRHFFIFSWVDMSVISNAKRLSLMKILKFMRKSLSQSPSSPVVVHCSAGIGRTGTLIALYHLYQDYLDSLLLNREFEFSVYDTVIRLRHMRRSMVQTETQYEFIFDFIRNFDQFK